MKFVKNINMRYKEKLSSVSFFHVKRFIKTISRFPIRSIRNRVVKVMINLTYRCECDCDYCWCGSYEKKPEQELSFLELKEIINHIAAYPSLLVLVSFIGGEPLLREDIYDLVRHAAKKGLFVEVETNGISLTEPNVSRLKKAGLNHMFVKIEGANRDKHDSLSKVKGCFEKAVRGIKLCHKEGISTSIFTNALKEKVKNGELPKIIRLAKELKVTSMRIIYPTLSGKWIVAEDQRLSSEEEEAVSFLLEPGFVYLESTRSYRKGARRFCAALEKNFFHISCYGEVQLCPFVPISFGNIRQKSLDKIVSTMLEHPIFYENYNGCLMNNIDFRRKYILPAHQEHSYRNITV